MHAPWRKCGRQIKRLVLVLDGYQVNLTVAVVGVPLSEMCSLGDRDASPSTASPPDPSPESHPIHSHFLEVQGVLLRLRLCLQVH